MLNAHEQRGKGRVRVRVSKGKPTDLTDENLGRPLEAPVPHLSTDQHARQDVFQGEQGVYFATYILK